MKEPAKKLRIVLRIVLRVGKVLGVGRAWDWAGKVRGLVGV